MTAGAFEVRVCFVITVARGVLFTLADGSWGSLAGCGVLDGAIVDECLSDIGACEEVDGMIGRVWRIPLEEHLEFERLVSEDFWGVHAPEIVDFL